MSDLRVVAENQQTKWNSTEVDLSLAPLPVLLRRTIAEHPEKVALRDSTGMLTYAELGTRIDSLAAHLRSLGLRRVACELPRGMDAVVTQAAVFAAGATYVPGNATDVVPADLVISEPPAPPELAGPLDVKLDDIAYVIRTSGTSGRPKPVAVSHRAIANSTLARLHRYPTPVTAFALISPMTFDSSLAGIWWTLLCGGELRLLSPDTSEAVTELAEAMSGGAVSHTLLTPSLHRAALSTMDKAKPGLRQVIVAGEPCPRELVSEHYRMLPDVALVNEYGPTEAAVWCTAATLLPGADVVVGTPIANTEVWVVDDTGGLAPVGELGEVCVAGAGLADGYLGDPELTRAKFGPHPLDPDRLAYRTGDLGRWRADGQLELRGRLDNQVKIRGYRVEPDGVAAALRRHDGVRDAVVVHRDGLVAYVVPEWDEESAADELRQAWTGVVDDLDQHDERSGWTSSATGERLSEEDMTEWVAATVALASEGAPESVLELGCGTGQLLTPLAAGRSRVVGVDVSKPALDALGERLRAAGLGHVELRHGDARTTETGFDLVLCNSVTQYFPSEDYLTEVVTGAVNAGRRVVIGDVLDLGLRDAFHAAVVLASAGDDEPSARLRERWRRRVERDPQLLVDPRWFQGKQFEVRPRRGRRRNEMNDFRFDVVSSPDTGIEVAWRDWSGDIELAGAEPIGVQRIPNARCAGACAVRSALPDDSLTAADLRRIAAEAEASAVHPEDLVAKAREAGWTVRLSRASGWPQGELDAVFFPPGKESAVRWPAPQPGGDLVSAPLHRHVIAGATERLLPELREHAAKVLADYERPIAYVALTGLPLTAHGKIDLAALPAPSADRPELSTPYVPPVGPVECRVAEVLASLLGVDRVGLHDDFVELGGDSLLAMRAAVRLGDHFGVPLPIRTVFDLPTVAQLAARLAESPRAARPESPDAPEGFGERLPLSLSQMLIWGIDVQLQTGLLAGPECKLEFHYRIHGPLDTEVLSAAVDELVARHESLRLTVHLEPDMMKCYQVVDPPGTGLLETVASVGELRPLSITDGRVFAAGLVRYSDDDHVLVLRMHHIVADAFTVDIVEQELSALYNGKSLPEPVSYRAVLARPPAPPDEADISYWAAKVAGCSPIELIPPSSVDSMLPHSTELRSILLPAGEAQAFLRFARDHKTTAFTALYTVFAALVAADTGDTDVRMLAVNGARKDAELQRMAGIWVDGTLLRHRLRTDLPASEVLAAANADVHGALRHDSVPLLGLAQILPDMTAIFTQSQGIVFELLGPSTGLDLAGCPSERTDQFMDEFPGKVFQLPTNLAVVARPVGDTLRLTGMFDPTFAPQSYMDGLLTRMRELMAAFAEQADRPLGELLSADEWLTSLWKEHEGGA
ncbi:hypothetical protein Lesp02_31450 [Lentzea sp. NBRC 105346]|uniref:non-ribosomal peptide synthetase n=1 Tax=Lentzea sp. NBRC 105346 TaxID=3032205 RepID=UPI0024A3642F|nr:AMP-binding protein [Lentzea sp. NBRC 105346]GLZ30956.1 hypothetical protein Lesp02_31450 [Lentzea sp. NBRC 105346]